MIFRLKAKQHKRYTVIPTETLRDTRLSDPARSLLLYLLSKDETYSLDYSELCTAFGVHYNTMKKRIKELIKYGYVERECHIDTVGKGRFYWTFFVYALPKDQYYRELYKFRDRERQRQLRKEEKKIFQYRKELWGKE